MIRQRCRPRESKIAANKVGKLERGRRSIAAGSIPVHVAHKTQRSARVQSPGGWAPCRYWNVHVRGVFTVRWSLACTPPHTPRKSTREISGLRCSNRIATSRRLGEDASAIHQAPDFRAIGTLRFHQNSRVTALGAPSSSLPAARRHSMPVAFLPVPSVFGSTFQSPSTVRNGVARRAIPARYFV